jgi:hypothetical protein
MSTEQTGEKKMKGLKSLVLEDLKMRGIHAWTQKAPQSPPNRKASAKLERRRRAWAADNAGKGTVHFRTEPGSYNRKRG